MLFLFSVCGLDQQVDVGAILGWNLDWGVLVLHLLIQDPHRLESTVMMRNGCLLFVHTDWVHVNNLNLKGIRCPIYVMTVWSGQVTRPIIPRNWFDTLHFICCDERRWMIIVFAVFAYWHADRLTAKTLMRIPTDHIRTFFRIPGQSRKNEMVILIIICVIDLQMQISVLPLIHVDRLRRLTRKLLWRSDHRLLPNILRRILINNIEVLSLVSLDRSLINTRTTLADNAELIDHRLLLVSTSLLVQIL